MLCDKKVWRWRVLGSGVGWGEMGEEGMLRSHGEQSHGLGCFSPSACGSPWEALMLRTCLSVVHGCKRTPPPAQASEALSGGG